ncbi:coproporphyrinogen dehydrogenase HemZ, partial [Anaerosalibacter bizertensis]|nr:coproporphyrinogen dehydrogenase HemZ [Anaerosalibacter bizertensis]
EAGRPDTLTVEKLQMLRENYIERISINPQTMNLKTLETIGRMHTDKDIIRTFNLAREIGFSNINMDIIMGLPGEDINDVKNTLEIISELRPENLTVHTLAVKRVSKFRKTIDAYSLKDQNTINSMLELSKKYAKNMGLLPYYLYRQKQMLGNLENIGYSIEGKECIYNMLIMEERETIIALGAGGVSKIFYPNENRFERVPNVKSLKDYLLRTEEMVERKRKFIDTI